MVEGAAVDANTQVWRVAFKCNMRCSSPTGGAGAAVPMPTIPDVLRNSAGRRGMHVSKP